MPVFCAIWASSDKVMYHFFFFLYFTHNKLGIVMDCESLHHWHSGYTVQWKAVENTYAPLLMGDVQIDVSICDL